MTNEMPKPHAGDVGQAGYDGTTQPHFTAEFAPRQDLEVARLRAAAETACAQSDLPTYWHYRRAMLLRQAELYPLVREVKQ